MVVRDIRQTLREVAPGCTGKFQMHQQARATMVGPALVIWYPGGLCCMPPLSERSKYLLILSLVSALILVIGWQVRPTPVSEIPVSSAEVSRLQRLTQRSTLDNMGSYFADVADRVRNSLVWVDELDAPGIVWDSGGSILAPASPMRAGMEAKLRTVTEAEYVLLADLYSETPEFRLLKAPGDLALVPVQTVPAGVLRPGNWLAVVRRSSPDTHEVEATLFTGTRRITCGDVEVREMMVGLASGARPLGAGVFDLEGRFYGVVLQCDGVRRVITAESLGRAIDRAREIDSQLQFRYGFRPAEMNEAQKEYFQTKDGLLVKEIWRDTLAWNLGIRPGDICLALDDEPLTRLEDLAIMTVPMYRPKYTLRLRRGRQERTVVFPPGMGLQTQSELPAQDAVIFASPARPASILAVRAGSAAARAGILTGDRLVSIGPQFGTTRVNPEELNQDRDTPLFVVVEREHALHGLFVQ
jgi:hypothetical protein